MFMAKTKNILLNYENKWVAMNKKRSKVIESADSFEVLKKKVKKKDKGDIVVTRVLPFDLTLAPNVKAQN